MSKLPRRDKEITIEINSKRNQKDHRNYWNWKLKSISLNEEWIIEAINEEKKRIKYDNTNVSEPQGFSQDSSKRNI